MITSYWSLTAAAGLAILTTLDIDGVLVTARRRHGAAIGFVLALAVLVAADGPATATVVAGYLVALDALHAIGRAWWDRRHQPVGVVGIPNGNHLHYARGFPFHTRYEHATDVCWCNPDRPGAA